MALHRMRAAAPPLQGGPPAAPRIQPEPRVQLEVAPDAVLTGSVEASHAPAASSDVVATVVVRGGAFLLHAVLPLSMAVVLGVVTGLLPRALPWPLVAWAVAEVVFYVYFRWRHAHAQRAVPVRSGMGTLERRALLQRCIGVIDDGGAFLSGWFQGHPASDIPFGNAQRWLAWAFFEDDWDALSPADMAEVDTLLHHFEQHAGIVLRPGYNPELKPIRLTLDDVHAVHKPALYYAALSLAHAAFVLWMRAHGAQRGTAGLLTYWHFQPTTAPSSASANANANAANAVPIVFFHGMGVGPAVYVQLIVQLLRLHVPLYIVELPHISSALSDVVPARADILDGTAAMLHAHGHGRAVFLGHSMGTVYAGWIAKHRPELVESMVLIDPVVFLLCHPDVAFNFVYRKPQLLSEWAIHLYVATELAVARMLHRHFVWTDNIVWAEQLPAATLVVLSETDAIVPSPAVHTYLMRAIATKTARVPLDVWLIPSTGHAGFLLQPAMHVRLATYISGLLHKANADPPTRL